MSNINLTSPNGGVIGMNDKKQDEKAAKETYLRQPLQRKLRRRTTQSNYGQNQMQKFIDSEEDQMEKKKRQKQRFGHNISNQKSKLSTYLKFTGIIIAILFIPIQLFLKEFLEDYETEILVNKVQKWVTEYDQDDDSMLFWCWDYLIQFSSTRVTMAIAMFLFLATDSFIAFKSTMLYFLGLWIMILLKMLYQSPRPFWVNKQVFALKDMCQFDYANPSLNLFNLWFFYGYAIHMYLYQYRAKVNYTLIGFSVTALGTLMVLTSFGLYVFGNLFLYQSIVTILYSVSFNIMCISFDQQIVTWCEQVGFIIQSSRKMKFIIMFWCLSFLLCAILIYTTLEDDWGNKQFWIINAVDQPVCSEKLFQSGAWKLGGQSTFHQSSILFYIIGLGFGTSYSLLEVDVFDFVHTHWLKKILRAILGCSLAQGIYFFFGYFNSNESTFLTQYCFNGIFPYFLVPFTVYGPFQVLCKIIGLVDIDSSNDFQNDNTMGTNRKGSQANSINSQADVFGGFENNIDQKQQLNQPNKLQ